MRWAERQRIDFIRKTIETRGWIIRQDIVDKFGVSKGQATQDIAKAREENPGLIEYDRNAKCFAKMKNAG